MNEHNDHYWLTLIHDLEKQFPSKSSYRPIHPWEDFKQFYIGLVAQLRFIHCIECQDTYNKIDWSKWFQSTKGTIVPTPKKECYCEIKVK